MTLLTSRKLNRYPAGIDRQGGGKSRKYCRNPESRCSNDVDRQDTYRQKPGNRNFKWGHNAFYPLLFKNPLTDWNGKSINGIPYLDHQSFDLLG